jgi:hypothetical protein
LTTNPGELRQGRARECERVLDDVIARRRGADDLDQRHLGHRVEEVQADEPAGIREVPGEVLEHDARGVGRKHRFRLHARLELRVQPALRIGVLEDRLDHDVGLGHARPLDVRPQSRRHLRDLRRVFGALREEIVCTLERGLDVLHLAVLQRHREAARGAPGRDVAAHDACADDVHSRELAP